MVEGQLEETEHEPFQNNWKCSCYPDVGLGSLLPPRIIAPLGDGSNSVFVCRSLGSKRTRANPTQLLMTIR
jgi:hypothetical protein